MNETKPPIRVNFYNTFELVVPLWRALLASGLDRINPEFVISGGTYRGRDVTAQEKGFSYTWVPAGLKNSKLFCHLLYYVTAPLKIWTNKGELDVFYTQPPLFFVFGSFISRLKKRKYAVHIMDYHPDILATAGKLKENGIIFKLLSSLVTSTLKKADLVIVIGDCMKTFVQQKGVSKDKLAVIENVTSYSEEPISSTIKSRLESSYGLKDEFVIYYSGNMGVAHEFDTLLDLAETHRDQGDLKIVVSGYGKKKGYIESAKKEKGLDNVLVLGFLEQNEFSYLMSRADAVYISLKEEYTGKVVPSKFYSSLAAGKAIIFEGSESGEISKTITNADCGAVIPCEDKQTLSLVVKEYIDGTRDAATEGNNALSWYREFYTTDKIVDKYIKELEGVVNGVR